MAIYAYANLNGNTTYVSSTDLNFTGTWMPAGTYVPPRDVASYGNGNFIVLIQNYGTVPQGSGSWSDLILFKPDPPTPPAPDVGPQALALANAAYSLACIGTNVGTNAINLAMQALGQSATGAYNLAAIGTNVGTNALNAAAQAEADAQSAISGVNGVMTISVAGTNRANAAYALAQIGTNVGTNALNAAAAAQATANSAISGVNGNTIIAVAGTNLANEALSIAIQGTNLAREALSIAIDGTNIAREALGIAIAGTNAVASTLVLLSAGTTFGTNIAIPNGTNFVYVGGLNLPFTPSCVTGNIAMPDVNSLNLWPTWVGQPTTDGFVASLNGVTDSANYRLHFMIRK